ncbi:DegT/DnrJ/EryC1/StrS family aminotransferase [Aequorivita marisscotiae]|uniref:DegT/DnrJ/EryC1/StrS aminotransferase family protein n=1 Tax=Aequorivita marisscotiae TaxID=3040348 RepID=A0ABY8KRW8_9FLAO|nr:DegT/DnrJ/EryC1/StrS aminotransferase family protein [Aequorivita sp. Ant34-E75]WGF92205.1 DegT/DnrJ/EryC1/StrS aminotransferase family protein [Aequorivita sp. Ant34-E75]
MNYQLALKKEIAAFLNCEVEEVILTWKGRVSLFGILKSLKLQENDEIIIPAFTCVVVPNAIIYNNLKPVYVDVDPKTYNIEISKIENAITNRTKVILAQNTFGLSSDMDALKVIAKKHNLFVIEDCTHGFGGSYKNHLNGTTVDAAFFSSQWNKMFSTGIGGFAIIKNPILREKMNEFERQLVTPSLKDEIVLKIQLFAKNILGYKALYWNALKLYRYLSKKNIVIGSSSGGEMGSTEMPTDYLKGLSNVQCKKGVFEVKRIKDNVTFRQNIAKYYDNILIDLGKEKLFAPPYAEHTYTKYPILVKDRDFFLQEAEKYKLPIHDWFISQIHPIKEDFQKWFLIPNKYPISEKLANHIVNLPTDFSVNNNLKKRIADFLEIQRSQIVSFEEL